MSPAATEARTQRHEVQTAPDCGWAGKRNGQLLLLAAKEFDVFLTVDRKLQYQQNLSRFDIAVVVVIAPSNSIIALRPIIPKILNTLSQAAKGEATIVGQQNVRSSR